MVASPKPGGRTYYSFLFKPLAPEIHSSCSALDQRIKDEPTQITFSSLSLPRQKQKLLVANMLQNTLANGSPL
jgi:hypothetical protein